MNPDTREALIRTLGKLKREGWRQGVGVPRWCLSNALAFANFPTFPVDTFEAASEARALLLDLTGEPDKSIAHWNDAPGRTEEEVFDLLDRAIAMTGEA